jgi:hypothetical protein
VLHVAERFTARNQMAAVNVARETDARELPAIDGTDGFTSDLHCKCVRKTALTRCPFGVELRPMVGLTSSV